MAQKSRTGFSMVELIVVMAVIAVIVAIAVPAIARIRQTSSRVQCLNNLRNIALGLIQFDQAHNRLPASGSFLHDKNLTPHPHSNWAFSILPYVDQANLFAKFNPGLPLTDPANRDLGKRHVPLYVCSVDLSRSKKKLGDLSYAVNGGIGFTVRHQNGVRDCPVAASGDPLDFNGDGVACSGEKRLDDLDRSHFKMLSLFFLETSNTDVTKRHHSLGDVVDGTSQTFLVTENVRTGYLPDSSRGGFIDPDPGRCAFYIGNPCLNATCSEGSVDYARCNAGDSRINSGLWAEEGHSPVPNSFHTGGVNMACADGHVSFLSESVDGAVYAALSSPQGLRLDKSPLKQAIVSDNDF